MRKTESDDLCKQQKFLNWAAFSWRAKTSLSDLLKPLSRDLKGLSYHHKVRLIYGQYVESQFQVVDTIEARIARWDALRARQVVTLACPMSAMEALCVSYFQQRLEVGRTFLVPTGMAAIADLGPLVDAPSAIQYFDIMQAYFDPMRAAWPCHSC